MQIGRNCGLVPGCQFRAEYCRKICLWVCLVLVWLGVTITRTGIQILLIQKASRKHIKMAVYVGQWSITYNKDLLPETLGKISV